MAYKQTFYYLLVMGRILDDGHDIILCFMCLSLLSPFMLLLLCAFRLRYIPEIRSDILMFIEQNSIFSPWLYLFEQLKSKLMVHQVLNVHILQLVYYFVLCC